MLATPLGVAAAYAIASAHSRLMRAVHVALMLPIIIPAIGVLFVYANLGLVATLPGLVLANVMLGLPYVVISVSRGSRPSTARRRWWRAAWA